MSLADADVVRRGLQALTEACRAARVEDGEATVGVSADQARILRQLHHTDPTMVGELAEFFGVTPSTMSLNLKRLESVGCVRRSRDPDDRRVMNVRLTDVGQRIKEASSDLDPAKVDEILQALRPQDRTRAVDGVRLLLEGAQRVSERAEGYLGALTGEDDI